MIRRMSAEEARIGDSNIATNTGTALARRQLLADYLCFKLSELVPDDETIRPRGDVTPNAPAVGPPVTPPRAAVAPSPAPVAPSSTPVAAVPRYGSPAEAQAAAIERAVKALRMARRPSQVLTQLLNGASEKQIAASLSISKHTVHTYVKQLHARMNVASRGELLSRFVGTPADNVPPGS